jgi:hypothetical protein
MPKVFNKYHKDAPPGAVYIGRPSKWGNPFEIGRDGTREEVVARHREWLMSQPELIEVAKQELRGKNLVCFCAPKSCHGDTLLKVANEKDEQLWGPCKCGGRYRYETLGTYGMDAFKVDFIECLACGFKVTWQEDPDGSAPEAWKMAREASKTK